ncbi:ComEC family competence protein, partial [Candidatus Kaiserbacteria bacterium]|nr:ComEC family competence protein [Candidatus Kaiserbacteria bacterium]
MKGAYFYTAVLCFASGIFVRSFFEIGLPIVLWLMILALGVMVVWRKKSEALFAPYLVVLCFGFIFLALGILRLELTTLLSLPSMLEAKIGKIVELTCIVIREPDVRERSQHLTVKVANETILVTTDRYATVSYGDEITFKGKLELPASFETDFGRTFNYAGYLKARGISYTMSFVDLSTIAINRDSRFLYWLYQNKKNFTQILESNIPEPQVGLGEGLLLGIKQALGSDIEDAFRKTGIIHIVVLSGYNVLLVVTFVMYILAVFLRVRLRAVVGIMAIILFALLVGLSATVIRASIMAILVLVAEAIGRQYAIWRGLFLAGLVMLLINPYLLVYDIGFQLSFMATLGLILIAPQFETSLIKVPTTIGIRGFLLATLATQIAVAPLLLYHMGQFSVVAVIVNVLVLPAVSTAMLLTFLTGIVGGVSAILALPFAYGAYLVLSFIIKIAVWFST